MTGDADLETRRKRLLYRSIYRGNKENDILLGQFARAEIETFDAGELDEYEALLSRSDNEIFDWVSGQAPVPPEAESRVLRRLMAFRVRF